MTRFIATYADRHLRRLAVLQPMTGTEHVVRELALVVLRERWPETPERELRAGLSLEAVS